MTDLRDRIRTLLAGQYLAVRSSSGERAPCGSLLAFAAAEVVVDGCLGIVTVSPAGEARG